jgi:hypothetical protein
MRNRRRQILAALVTVTVMLGGVIPGAGDAGALIGSSSGDILFISPPPSVLNGALQDATRVLAFNEQQGVTLASVLRADFVNPGTYNDPTDLGTVTLPAGTVVDSHFVHSDPTVGGNPNRTFTLNFPTAILGVVATRTRLAASDVLGAAGTTYPGAAVNRELEFSTGSGADVVILPDQRTIQATFQTPGAVDDMRVLTVHNSPPLANAGGPYAAVEGSPVTLAGTASDPDGNALTKSWAFSWTGSAGTSCSATGTTTLTPTVTCNDNALVTATLSVNDGVNASVTSVANVTVGNVAPHLGTLVVPGSAVALGSSVPVSVPFTDAGTHDTHTATITWGDTTSSSGSVTESGGSGTAAGSHTYAAPGLYTVAVTVKDDDLGTVTASSQVAVNGPPTADAGGPYNGSEGLPVGLVGTSVDPENDALTTNWSFTPSGLDAGGVCNAIGATTLIPSLTCTDDAVVVGSLTASDGINAPVSSSATITIDNEAPLLGPVSVDPGPIPTGQTISVSAPFTDGGTNDTHTATVAWGDLTTSVATITESGGVGVLNATHSYTTPGAYTISVVLTDDDLGVDSGTTSLIVNSPPTADAGGPYAGTEGALLSLTGTATDVDADALATSWGFTWTGDAGTSCTAAGADTLTPTLTCTDNATVTATLTVDDGVNPPVLSTTMIEVGNAPPELATLVAPGGPLPIGTSAPISVAFTDPGTNDTHIATVDWGDSTSMSATVSESGGSGSASAAHVYGTFGVFHVTVTVKDDNLGVASATADVVVNGSPVVNIGGPYAGTEGTGVLLDASAIDPDDGTLDVGWTYTWTGDPGTICVTAGGDTLTPLVTCNDNAVVTANLSVSDRINPPVVAHTTFTIANVAPTLTPVVPSESPVATGSTVSVGLTVADVGTNDTHTATVDWGDASSSAGVVTETAGAGTITAAHVYPTHGTYHVTVTVTDDNGGQASTSTSITVNGQPSVGAGGPYAGVEGAGVTLSGTAVDPEADALAVTWTYTVVGADAGTLCSLTGEHTLTPVVTCTDDALVTTTLSASDGVNPAVHDTATVDIRNAPPTVSAPVVAPNPVAVGGTVALSSAFADQGINDDHTATISWGDASSSAATVTETLGAGGTASGSHSYSAPGDYLVKVTVNDKDGGVGTATTHVVVSAPPVVHAGGPYHGVEGTPTALAGSATDPEGDPLVLAWTFTWTGAPGTVCSATGTATATPSVTCNDDATVTATLTVSDGLNAAVADTATLVVGNAAPTVGTVTVPGGSVAVGAPVNLVAGFTDAGTHDTHTAAVAWGDTSSSAASVTETSGSGSASATHSFSASGTYTVVVTVTDDNGGAGTGTATVVVNGAPIANAGGPYAGVEGSPIKLAATASDPNGDALGITWTFTWTGSAGTACTATAVTTLTPSVTCNDDATVTATLRVSDAVNPTVLSTATINVANVAPTAGALTVPIAPVPLGTAANVLTSFTDVGRNDTHTATVSWGDTTTSAGVVTEVAGSGSVTAAHVYAASGTFTVSVTIRDDNGGTVTVTATTSVVVYNRSLSFVTGGGWIDSPSGAYTPGNSTDANLVGRGNFGFVARYPSPTSTVPTGDTEFQLRVRKPHSGEDDEDDRCRNGDRWDDDRTTTQSLDFHSTGFVWLVVDATGTKAYYRGTGTVNGVGGYEFIVSVIDGRSTHAPDRFRIKIWKTSTGVVLYDSQPGAADDATATNAVSGGSIVIH